MQSTRRYRCARLGPYPVFYTAGPFTVFSGSMRFSAWTVLLLPCMLALDLANFKKIMVRRNQREERGRLEGIYD